jgi:RNA polymerase sigma-70 factor (ECF subfamily)
MDEPSTDSMRTYPSLLEEVRDPRNHEAWGRFIARYGPMIRGWCRQWFPREADDRAYDVFSELVFRMVTFEYDPSQGRFRGWLKTVTHRLMARLKDGEWRLLGDGCQSPDSLEATEDLEARLAAEFDLELLEIAKERVRGRVADHTWRAYVETAERGRRPAEVAEELGLKVGTVYQARYSVINELGREIEDLQGLA